ncbi:hypothetical protein SPHINGO391_350232 [Sphingomonas aurantiaca]|uniref:Uncharacterized protein n=1 Tax=Sphingomonas aurantiaca TaxID=185949 RepID=A0A5E7Y4K6_9SPHN|nr:hypothetical protein SPHINGO391_350232 [Sphingomonas aurantiaca]
MAIGVRGEPHQLGTVTHGNAAAPRADRPFLLEPVERIGDAAATDAEHQAEFLVRHADIVVADPVMVEQDPARHAPLDRMRERRDDRPPHLDHEDVDEPQQRQAQRHALLGGGDEMLRRDAQRLAALGTHHHVVGRAAIAEQERPADKAFRPDQSDGVAMIAVERIEHAGDALFRKAQAVDRIARMRQRIADRKRHAGQMRGQQREVLRAQAPQQQVLRIALSKLLGQDIGLGCSEHLPRHRHFLKKVWTSKGSELCPVPYRNHCIKIGVAACETRGVPMTVSLEQALDGHAVISRAGLQRAGGCAG